MMKACCFGWHGNGGKYGSQCSSLHPLSPSLSLSQSWWLREQWLYCSVDLSSPAAAFQLLCNHANSAYSTHSHCQAERTDMASLNALLPLFNAHSFSLVQQHVCRNWTYQHFQFQYYYFFIFLKNLHSWKKKNQINARLHRCAAFYQRQSLRSGATISAPAHFTRRIYKSFLLLCLSISRGNVINSTTCVLTWLD